MWWWKYMVDILMCHGYADICWCAVIKGEFSCSCCGDVVCSHQVRKFSCGWCVSNVVWCVGVQSSNEEGEFSCGWCVLPFIDEQGNLLNNRYTSYLLCTIATLRKAWLCKSFTMCIRLTGALVCCAWVFINQMSWTQIIQPSLLWKL